MILMASKFNSTDHEDCKVHGRCHRHRYNNSNVNKSHDRSPKRKLDHIGM